MTRRVKPVFGLRFHPAERLRLEAIAAKRRQTLSAFVHDLITQELAHEEDATHLCMQLRQTIQLLEMYRDAPERQGRLPELLRELLRQSLRDAMTRLAAFEAQLTGEEDQP